MRGCSIASLLCTFWLFIRIQRNMLSANGEEATGKNILVSSGIFCFGYRYVIYFCYDVKHS